MLISSRCSPTEEQLHQLVALDLGRDMQAE